MQWHQARNSSDVISDHIPNKTKATGNLETANLTRFGKAADGSARHQLGAYTTLSSTGIAPVRFGAPQLKDPQSHYPLRGVRSCWLCWEELFGNTRAREETMETGFLPS